MNYHNSIDNGFNKYPPEYSTMSQFFHRKPGAKQIVVSYKKSASRWKELKILGNC